MDNLNNSSRSVHQNPSRDRAQNKLNQTYKKQMSLHRQITSQRTKFEWETVQKNKRIVGPADDSHENVENAVEETSNRMNESKKSTEKRKRPAASAEKKSGTRVVPGPAAHKTTSTRKLLSSNPAKSTPKKKPDYTSVSPSSSGSNDMYVSESQKRLKRKTKK